MARFTAGTTNASTQRVLWVEGPNDAAVVKILRHIHGVPENFVVTEKGGVDSLLPAIPVALRTEGLLRFGVVVDADRDVTERWRQLTECLLDEGYIDLPALPKAGGTIVSPPERRPVVGIWIMPDNAAAGAIEEFVAALVPDGDLLWRLAGETCDAIPPDHRRFSESRRGKAHLHTFLAWQEVPGLPMGRAILQGGFNPGQPLAASFILWLEQLFGSGEERSRHASG